MLVRGLNVVSKDELRALLESQVSSHLEKKPEAITLYAAKPLPERKPWRRRSTGQDLEFAQVINELAAESEQAEG